MSRQFDTVVVGGGVAGLACAARLAEIGHSVCLVESGLLGSGATTSNHGILHSGALYAMWHPEVVADCRRAQSVYRGCFPEAIIHAEPSWYVAHAATLASYQQHWARHGITATPVDSDRLQRTLPVEDVTAVAVDEVFVDTHTLLALLALRCQERGVELCVGTTVEAVVVDEQGVVGVQASATTILARQIVLCGGIDTVRLLGTAGSRLGVDMASRLELMVSLPGHVPHPVIGLEFGWPVIVPTAREGIVLASRYGGVQPAVSGRGRWPIAVSEASALVEEISRWMPSQNGDTASAAGWVCSKTEYVATGSDQWNTSPGYAVLDHGARENIPGLWTVLPGKMTLALHASRALTHQLTGHRPALILPSLQQPSSSTVADIEQLIAHAPWASTMETNS